MLGKAMLSGYGREHELESDRLGAQYLARTGYDPQAMLEVIGVLKDQELFERQRARDEGRQPRTYHGVFASHPENDQRLQEVVKQASDLKTTGTPRVGREAFLAQLEGLAFGPSENEGIVVDDHFYHKPLDVGLDFPSGWSIDNQPDRLVATAPEQTAVIQLIVTQRPPQVTPRQFLQKQGVRNLQRGESLNLVNFETYTAVAPAATSAGQRNARFIVLYDNDHAYLFTGVSRSAAKQRRFDDRFKGVARSFHRLSAAEKTRAAGLKLHLIETGSETRIEALARQSPIPEQAEAELRLLNGLYPAGEPHAGDALKVVR